MPGVATVKSNQNKSGKDLDVIVLNFVDLMTIERYAESLEKLLKIRLSPYFFQVILGKEILVGQFD